MANNIEQLKELSKRSAKLNEALQQILSKYENISLHDEQYQSLLREFGLEDESRRQQKDANIKRYKMVTMLYIVIYGFHDLTQRPDSHMQLDKLDEIFINISDIASQHHLCKIPTIGDNMLFAGGVPKENKTNPIDATLAAYEIMQRVNRLREGGNCAWEIGIGVHTGPVIGRFANGKNIPYTLSGNNVLTTSRLGLGASKGCISLSPMTVELTREFFHARQVGQIPVKYSGNMDVYNLVGLLPEMQRTEPQRYTNGTFDLSYNRLQFMDLQEYVLDMLEEQLPKNLYYHNVKHTIDVTTEVELIGWNEGLCESDIQLLKIAALFHDSGHIRTYKGHEEKSCEFVDEILPRFGYSADKIATIKRIIMATKLPHTPNDILEAVIQDSDLDYLGRTDFIPVSNELYRELKERNMIGTVDEWNEMQIKFISSHQYYTQTAQSLREVNKQKQIEHIRELLNHQ